VALTLFAGDVKKPKTFLRCTIKVIVARKTRLHPYSNKGTRKLVSIAPVFDVQWFVVSVILRRAEGVGL
jgi:hypothetical protein